MIRIALIFLIVVSVASAAEPLSFNRDIRPILSENCFACHGFDSKKREAELRLDTPEGAYTAKDGTFPIKPRDLAKSEVWQRIITTDEDDLMPPPKSHKKLTQVQKDTIKQWIEQGAGYQKHWAFEKPAEKAGASIDALLAARQDGGSQPEVGAAVFRVEHRLGQLTDIVRSLQQRVGQGIATADGGGGAQPPEKGGNGGGTSVVRFDTMVDFQSPSNFYRWGPKADVVNEGGVFVSTRRRPPNIGQEVLLRITLPGGAELESRALVEWTRPAGHPQGAPGFGARFVDLPSYARQLVDHFVAKRPPIIFEQA